MELDSLTSFKVYNYSDLVLVFTSNGILNTLIIIRSTNSLARAVNYAEQSWIGHAHSLYGIMLDNWKNYQIFFQGFIAWVSRFYISNVSWFMESDDTYLERSMNFLLSHFRHITFWRVPAQYGLFALILWYVAKSILRS